jgi:hypothetical protein
LVGLLAFAGLSLQLADRVRSTPGGLSEEAAALASREAAALGWPVVEGDQVSLGSGRGYCTAGWLEGAVDRYRTRHDWPGAAGPGSLILSFTTYASEPAAAADLARARSSRYLDCQQRDEPQDYEDVTGAVASHLPPDPQVPGVGFAIHVWGPRVAAPSYEFVVVVGRMRGHVDLCACPGMTFEEQRQVAVAVAAAMAEVQGLPRPGG